MGDYINVKEIFGCDVFNDSVMQDRLPKKVYRELKKTIEEGKELSMDCLLYTSDAADEL